MQNAAVKPSQTKLVIDGKLCNSFSGKTFQTIDPRSGTAICSIQEAGVEDVTSAVKAARKAFDHVKWPRMSGQNIFKDLLPIILPL